MKKLTIIFVILGLLINCPSGYAQTKASHHKSKTQNHRKKNPATAKRTSKRVPLHNGVARHRGRKIAKRTFKTAIPKISTIENHTNVAVVEIKNGSIYVNDAFVSTIKSLKNEDQKIIINNIPSSPLPLPLPQPESSSIPQEKPVIAESARPILGVHTCDCYEDGAVIDAVLPCSPADGAGLFPGDLITKIDDHEISSPRELIETLKRYSAGDNISITYEDNNHTETRKIKLAKKAKADYCGCFETQRHE